MQLQVIIFALITVIFGACGGGGNGGGGTAPTAPTVLSTTATNQRLYTTSPISVTFSTAMNQASVEAAFQITGSGPAAGTFTWNDNTVTFTPQALWKTHHLYTLTIQNTAADANGTPMAEAFTQTFRPGLNMNDINADGIDDIVASAFKNDEGGVDAGMVYVFLGKTSWSNIDLAAQTADAQYNVLGPNTELGFSSTAVGDINGDGYADLLASTPDTDLAGTNRGLVIVIYGSASPASRTYTGAETDVSYFVGAEDNVRLGLGVYSAGDVNGDGLADFLIGGALPPGDSQFWLVFGQTDPYGPNRPITDVSRANFIVAGDESFFSSQMYKSCDINGDELDDIILTAYTAPGGGVKRGEVYYIKGQASPANLDLRTEAADATFTGAQNNDQLGLSLLCTCADINRDGYADILMGAPMTGGDHGTAYLVLGSSAPASINFSTESASATFSGPPQTYLGYALSVPGDVNNDGYNDMLIGAPFKNVSSSPNIGEAYLFYGSAAPASVDLNAGGSANVTYTGQIPPAGKITVFGFSRPFGDVNGDGIDDLVMNAMIGPNGTGRGVIYIVFGSADLVNLNFGTQSADVTITGHADNDALSIQTPLL
jgi:hypothetical protein